MNLNLYPQPKETLLGTACAIRNRELSCRATVERCLQQIDTHEDAIQAWVTIDRERALAKADALDQELSQTGPRSVLHGIPIGIKDIIDVESFVTGCGSTRMSAAPPAIRDAEVVRRLVDAGAIVLGKTVTTAFAFFDPPKTKNPWNQKHTPGGSSSGSAAAVATGMCLAALGTQTGGSIIRPAAFCGIVGVKPRFKAVSRAGIFPFAPSLDHVGPMTRTVSDAAAILKILQREDCGQSALSDQGSISPPMFCTLDIDYLKHVDEETRHAWHQMLDEFRQNGAHISRFKWPGFVLEEIWQRHRILMAAEIAADHQERLQQFPDDYPVNVRSLIEEGLKISAAQYLQCRQDQSRMRHAFADGIRNGSPREGSSPPACLLFPAAPGPAPDCTTTGNPRMNSPFSYLGNLSITVPLGISSSGLPLGVQFVSTGLDEVVWEGARWAENLFSRGDYQRRTFTSI